MPHDFFDPTPKQQNLVLIDVANLREAERMIESCEHCNPGAEIPFDWILDRVTGSDSSVTDYILEEPAKCPKCRHDILEKTLIEPAATQVLRMGINWQDVIMALGGGTVFLWAAAWLIRTVITDRMARDAEAFKIQVKSSADKEVETLKIRLQATADTEIERLKNALQMAAEERRVRFSTLHETRAREIAQLYKRLVSQSIACQSYVIRMSEEDRQRGFQKLEDDFMELSSFVETIRIYLPEHICVLLDKLLSHIRQPAINIFVYGAVNQYARPEVQQKRNEAFMSALKAFDAEIPAAKKALEEEFRKIFGVETTVAQAVKPE